MPSEHARLSPSSADRWISCPASARIIEKLDIKDEGSAFAAEGTLAHTLGELRASRRFGHLTEAEFLEALGVWEKELEGYPEGTIDEMEKHIAGYVDLLVERRPKDSAVFLEQRFPTGVPESWGTSDAVIVSPDHIEIVDLKYGAGVPVSAVGNPQLRLYALGALDEYDGLLGDSTHVTMTIYQPRIGGGSVSSDTMPVGELLRWREEVAIPAAVKALYEPYAHFGPSEKACRWCPLAGTCKPRMEYATRRDFGDLTDEGAHPPAEPQTLTPVEISRVLPRLKSVTAWAKDVESAALDLAYAQGVEIPGYKVVRSGGMRTIKDPTAAIQHLIELGFTAEQVADFKIKGFGVLEKLLGKKEVPEVLGDFISKTPGRESLAPVDDKREAITATSDAASDFKEAG